MPGRAVSRACMQGSASPRAYTKQLDLCRKAADNHRQMAGCTISHGRGRLQHEAGPRVK